MASLPLGPLSKNDCPCPAAAYTHMDVQKHTHKTTHLNTQTQADAGIPYIHTQDVHAAIFLPPSPRAQRHQSKAAVSAQ